METLNKKDASYEPILTWEIDPVIKSSIPIFEIYYNAKHSKDPVQVYVCSKKD